MDADNPLAELCRRLTKAREIFDRPQEDPPDKTEALETPDEPFVPDWQREGVVAAIEAIYEYLLAVGVETRLIHPLTALSGALADVDDGVSNELLKRRTPGPGRGPVQRLEQADRALACAAMTLFMRSGLSKRQAARRVTSKVPGMSTAQLGGWRDKIHAKENPAQQIYADMVAYGSEGDEATNLQAANILLKELIEKTS